VIRIDGRGGSDEVRADSVLHTSTNTTNVETRRVLYRSGTRVTGEYSIAPLPGVRRSGHAGWLAAHRAQRDSITADQRKAKVLFLGDSMVERFTTTGIRYWNSRIAPLGAVNLGLTGDTTSNLLYRIQDGLLTGLQPELVVLEIGTNNIGRTDSVVSVLRGIQACIRAISTHLPDATILLNSVFPRREAIEGSVIREVNTRLAQWDNGGKLRIMDLSPNYAPNNIVREDLFRSRDVHLNEQGYRLWSNLLRSTIDDLDLLGA
jgi:lysophospholipase L1-like esterase